MKLSRTLSQSDSSRQASDIIMVSVISPPVSIAAGTRATVSWSFVVYMTAAATLND
jgi:hypothetical protein